MKKTLAVAIFLAGIATAWASTVVFSPGTSVIQGVCVYPLADGGAGVTIRGTVTSQDGTITQRDVVEVQNLTGSARTTALNLISGGKTAWENAQGL